jgi:pimeloyl-ACP methyl ester carboxylesterase
MKSVRIQDTEIAYRIDGTQDPARPWIVMVHALGSDHRMWDAQAAFLAPRASGAPAQPHVRRYHQPRRA